MIKRNTIFKNIRKASLIAFSSIALISCSDDDDAPEEQNEEEVITTIIVKLTPEAGGTTLTLMSKDDDGSDGPNAPVVDVEQLAANTTYNATITLLNETESPAEDITLEVEEEDDEHQFFYTVSGAISSTEYTDMDEDGNPVGITFTLTTGDAGNGTLGVTLRHEPKKPNDGTTADAGGATDVEQTFSLTVE
ncbi:MAG: type 1 periplasmic binding fold superfamily protein [Cellulophaga sp.]|uniref:type 1 periplasmic binding fold superfamily protein n=1 Tax=unclassified Cellulophaga TaxID=2634405 RepID=UPI0026E2F69E|nr:MULTISPECIES: type 1 periplasmic binding fold superfamily protein [unclassified Cellulophaga]MDO6490418.1 type 1 periplasmic binding fold superfamily protein [Cellulophaga sp. 2_MG-2023]MDO6494388.1 type 1 periplasmic binding fold superfamily protein [Cellulophaga sp. 3_MG-2023]